MSELELCHWLLLEPTGNCRTVFAPIGDVFEDYVRVGAAASSPQFVFPLAFAVPQGNFPPMQKRVGEYSDVFTIRFCLHRDDRNSQGLAFAQMDSLKIATLFSEMSNAIAQWVESVGSRFVVIGLSDVFIEVTFRPQENSNPYNIERTLTLTKAGIEMMAYGRGLKVEDWITRS